MAKHNSRDDRDARERQANDHTRDAAGPDSVADALPGSGSNGTLPRPDDGTATGPHHDHHGADPVHTDGVGPTGGVKPAAGANPERQLRQLPLPGVSALDRVEQALKDAVRPYGIDGDPAQEKYPLLYEMCTVHQLQNGRSKQVATLSIMAHSNGWTATLRDLTLSVGLSVDADYLTDLLDALERELASPRPRWRQLRHGERASGIKSQDAKLPPPWEPGKKRS